MKARPAVRIIFEQVRLYGLLARYVYLHLKYGYLLAQRFLLKAAGAALIEAAKMELCIKSLSKEERVMFATCIAVSIYALALFMLIRL